MWCKRCRQDVPGVPSGTQGRLVCIRCTAPLTASTGEETSAHAAGVDKLAQHGVDLEATQRVAKPTFIDLDDWRLAEEVRQVTAAVRPRAMPVAQHYRQPAATIPAGMMPGGSAAVEQPAQLVQRHSRPPRSSFLAWLFLSFGLMAFLCGIVLLVWSVVGARSELWEYGMPFTVVGQAGLLLGLILQLERIWQGNRYTVDKLDHVDRQLDDLRATTTTIGVTHSSASQAFYSHLSQGASPHVLLADLKGQLDLLAVKMGERR